MKEDLTKLPARDLLARLMTAQHRLSTLVLAGSLVGEDCIDKKELAHWREIQSTLYDESLRRLALVPGDAK